MSVVEMKTIDETLNERGSRYGTFEGHASLSQELKCVAASRAGYSNLNDSQREALEMVFHKIARIINGDPNYDDSWVDIAGYTQLVVDQLRGKGR